MATDGIQESALHTAWISVGSNLGEKEQNCRQALAALAKTEGVFLSGVSCFYRTAPVDYLDQDWFVNGAAKVETVLLPRELLSVLLGIETRMGRTRETRFGPRVIDLDLLLYDDLVMASPELTLPHPRLHKRRFVLAPICDMDSNLVHPVLNKTMGELLPAVADQELIVLQGRK